MPTLSDNNRTIFVQLKNDYDNLPWYSKLFFPRALATQLNNIDSDGSNLLIQHAFDIYQAYINHTWFFHTWLFSSLTKFSNTSLNLALKTLRTAGLLSRDSAKTNFNILAKHQNPIGVTRALETLHAAGLLSRDSAQANFNILAKHKDPSGVAYALETLHAAGLLTGEAAQANFNAVAEHEDPQDVALALATLSTAGLLTGDSAQTNFNAVAKHEDPKNVARALKALSTAGLLTGEAAQANFQAVASNPHPSTAATILFPQIQPLINQVNPPSTGRNTFFKDSASSQGSSDEGTHQLTPTPQH